MRVHELKCFGVQPGEGNPALVIDGDTSPAQARQAFAAASGKSACVFVTAGDDAKASHVLDYYYPHMRSPLCLHATLAAAHVLFARQRDTGALTVRTAMRGQYLELSRTPDGYYAALATQPVPALGIADGLAGRLLGLPGIGLASAPQVASVGSPKLLIEVCHRATLAALRPDLALIVQWGKDNGVSGCYVYCSLGDGVYAGRNFNHLDPALEDSATGVAAGALSVLLQRGITLYQGDATGQRCMIRTRFEGGQALVGGAVEAVSG